MSILFSTNDLVKFTTSMELIDISYGDDNPSIAFMSNNFNNKIPRSYFIVQRPKTWKVSWSKVEDPIALTKVPFDARVKL